MGRVVAQADLQATDLSNALLWRTNSDRHAGVAAVRFPDSPQTWLPSQREPDGTVQPWNDKAYRDLRKMIESLPLRARGEHAVDYGESLEDALDRIGSLDCANPDPTLASCDPSRAPPPQAAAWRESLKTHA